MAEVASDGSNWTAPVAHLVDLVQPRTCVSSYWGPPTSYVPSSRSRRARAWAGHAAKDGRCRRRTGTQAQIVFMALRRHALLLQPARRSRRALIGISSSRTGAGAAVPSRAWSAEVKPAPADSMQRQGARCAARHAPTHGGLLAVGALVVADRQRPPHRCIRATWPAAGALSTATARIPTRERVPAGMEMNGDGPDFGRWQLRPATSADCRTRLQRVQQRPPRPPRRPRHGLRPASDRLAVPEPLPLREPRASTDCSNTTVRAAGTRHWHHQIDEPLPQGRYRLAPCDRRRGNRGKLHVRHLSIR